MGVRGCSGVSLRRTKCCKAFLRHSVIDSSMARAVGAIQPFRQHQRGPQAPTVTATPLRCSEMVFAQVASGIHMRCAQAGL